MPSRTLPLAMLILVAGCSSDPAPVTTEDQPLSITLILPAGDPDAALKTATGRCAEFGKAAVAKGADKQGLVFECQ